VEAQPAAVGTDQATVEGTVVAEAENLVEQKGAAA
jgi:hypothetical protein